VELYLESLEFGDWSGELGCMFWELFAAELILRVFQVCWHLGPFPSRSSTDVRVLHCFAVQVTLCLYSHGSAWKKTAKNRVPVQIGLNPSHFSS